MRNIKSLTVLLAVCVVAMSTGTAFAQSGVDPYRGVGEQVQGNLQGGSDNADQQPLAAGTAGATTAADDGGALPFTGLDVALIVAVGGALLAVGLGTRRLLRQTDPA
jgi:hypothetical protein